MRKNITSFLKPHISRFEDWIHVINDHNQHYMNEARQVEVTQKVADVLVEVSELCFAYGSFKDQFDNSKMTLGVSGPELIIQSLKMQCEFYLGIDMKGICLRTHLRSGENLRLMDDSFYKDIFQLMELGHFSIEQYEGYPDEITDDYDNLFKGNKSDIFMLIRNYVVGMKECRRQLYLGDFITTWSYDTNFYQVIERCCLTFKIFYNLNYRLWKITDSTRKKTL